MTAGTEAGARHAWAPALALGFNACVWGVSWWPLRRLQAAGLHPLWATALIYALAIAVITLRQPRAWGELTRQPALWLVVLASGTTNASFNWAMTLGDVVRVVLLFYLMPLWAALLARLLLGERLTARALLRMLLALAGAAIVLWPAPGAGGGWPLPRTLAEGLAVLGGFAFALNNVMLRREAACSALARALAMFCGGAVVATLLALATGAAWPAAPRAPWALGALALTAVFLLSNLALQYGAARLPANAAAVIMLSEVLVAAVSALLLGASRGGWALALGGALIVAASLLALRR